MYQASENIVVLNAGDEIPNGTEDYLKIYLAGSIDANDTSTFNWQDQFIEGLVNLTNQTNGLIMYKMQKFLIINPRYVPNNPTVSLDNPEFSMKLNWSQTMMDVSDGILCNFLKKSTVTFPMFEFGKGTMSGKMVVRCSTNYVNYPVIALTCEKYGIPLLPGKLGTVLAVLQSMFSYIPKFREIQSLQLPE